MSYTRAKKVSIHGTEYRVRAVVHTGWLDELPEFASILKIVVVDSSKVYFILTKYMKRQFISQYHAFEVCKPPRGCTIVLQQSQFKHYLPAHEVKLSNVVDGVMYISPRYSIPKC